MKIECKQQIKYGVKYRLSDGRICELSEDHPNPEKVIVLTDNGEYLRVYTGECDDGSLAIVETADTNQGFGWTDAGEYHCPCGTIFGKNLRDESPLALVTEHVANCVANAVQRLKNNHPFEPRPACFNAETWQRAVREYSKWLHNWICRRD